MFLLYNGQFLPESDYQLSLSNRAFQYGDGFFETLLLKEGELQLWSQHVERMKEASRVLQITLPKELVEGEIQSQALELAARNKCQDLARLKLKVWRGGTGLYTPQTDQAEWLLTAESTQPISKEPLKIETCQSVSTIPSVFSTFKGINAPVYILASREKAQKQVDDLLLLSPTGHVAELTYANIFWVKEKTIFTPGLETGCVNGVRRRKLLQMAKAKQWEVKEGNFSPTDLLMADLVFAGNVMGLWGIQKLNDQELGGKASLLTEMQRWF